MSRSSTLLLGSTGPSWGQKVFPLRVDAWALRCSLRHEYASVGQHGARSTEPQARSLVCRDQAKIPLQEAESFSSWLSVVLAGRWHGTLRCREQPEVTFQEAESLPFAGSV